MWKLATSLWGDQDKPLIPEPRRRIKGHPFLSCVIEVAKRRVSKVSAGALGLEVLWAGRHPGPGGAFSAR